MFKNKPPRSLIDFWALNHQPSRTAHSFQKSGRRREEVGNAERYAALGREVFTPQKQANPIPQGLRKRVEPLLSHGWHTSAWWGCGERWSSCQGGTEGLVYSRKTRGHFSRKFISCDPRLSTTQGTGVKDGVRVMGTGPSSYELPTSLEGVALGAPFQALVLEILRVSQ